MSPPEPAREYGDSFEMPEIRCPYCGARDQEAEDLGDHPSYLSGTCSECNKDFSLDVMSEEYFDDKGNKIPERKK